MEQTFASKPPLYTTLRHGMGCSEMELKKSFALRPDGLWSASTFAVWLEETSKTYVIYSLKSALFRGPRNTQLSGGERERVRGWWLFGCEKALASDFPIRGILPANAHIYHRLLADLPPDKGARFLVKELFEFLIPTKLMRLAFPLRFARFDGCSYVDQLLCSVQNVL